MKILTLKRLLPLFLCLLAVSAQAGPVIVNFTPGDDGTLVNLPFDSIGFIVKDAAGDPTDTLWFSPEGGLYLNGTLGSGVFATDTGKFDGIVIGTEDPIYSIGAGLAISGGALVASGEGTDSVTYAAYAAMDKDGDSMHVAYLHSGQADTMDYGLTLGDNSGIYGARGDDLPMILEDTNGFRFEINAPADVDNNWLTFRWQITDYWVLTADSLASVGGDGYLKSVTYQGNAIQDAYIADDITIDNADSATVAFNLSKDSDSILTKGDLYVNHDGDGAGSTSRIRFGGTNSKIIRADWTTDDRFEFNDNLHVEGFITSDSTLTADSALAIDTTYSPFQTYVSNHAGEGGSGSVDSTRLGFGLIIPGDVDQDSIAAPMDTVVADTGTQNSAAGLSTKGFVRDYRDSLNLLDADIPDDITIDLATDASDVDTTGTDINTALNTRFDKADVDGSTIDTNASGQLYVPSGGIGDVEIATAAVGADEIGPNAVRVSELDEDYGLTDLGFDSDVDVDTTVIATRASLVDSLSGKLDEDDVFGDLYVGGNFSRRGVVNRLDINNASVWMPYVLDSTYLVTTQVPAGEGGYTDSMAYVRWEDSNAYQSFFACIHPDVEVRADKKYGYTYHVVGGPYRTSEEEWPCYWAGNDPVNLEVPIIDGVQLTNPIIDSQDIVGWMLPNKVDTCWFHGDTLYRHKVGNADSVWLHGYNWDGSNNNYFSDPESRWDVNDTLWIEYRLTCETAWRYTADSTYSISDSVSIKDGSYYPLLLFSKHVADSTFVGPYALLGGADTIADGRLSPAIWGDSNSEYKMAIVEDTGGPPRAVLIYEIDTLGQHAAFIDTATGLPDSIWHLDVLERGAGELTAIAYCGVSSTSYLQLARSFDGGLTWETADKHLLNGYDSSLYTGGFPSCGAQNPAQIYRSTGFWVDRGDETVLGMYIPRMDTCGAVNEVAWHLYYREVTFSSENVEWCYFNPAGKDALRDSTMLYGPVLRNDSTVMMAVDSFVQAYSDTFAFVYSGIPSGTKRIEDLMVYYKSSISGADSSKITSIKLYGPKQEKRIADSLYATYSTVRAKTTLDSIRVKLRIDDPPRDGQFVVRVETVGDAAAQKVEIPLVAMLCLKE